MDRKGIIGIICVVVGMISWQMFVSKQVHKAGEEAAAYAAAHPAPAATPAPADLATPAAAAAATPTAAGTTPAVAPAVPLVVAAPSVPAQLEKLASNTVEYTFTNLGGGIARAQLLNHNAEKKDSKVVLNEFGPLPIGAISEVAGEGISEPYKATPGAGEISFERTDSRGLQTLKKYVLPKLDGADKATVLRDEYLVRMEVNFTNKSEQPLQVPAYFIYSGSSAPIHQRDQPIYTGFNFYRNGSSTFIDVNWFKGGGMLSRRAPASVFTESGGQIRWAGVTNQYFTSLVTPVVDERSSSDVLAKHVGSQVWARRFVVNDPEWIEAGHSTEGAAVQKAGEAPSQERFAIDGAIGMPGFTLKPGESFTQAFEIYTGPREYRRLKELGTDQDDVLAFGMFGIVSKTLLTSMNVLRTVFGNYAWAIIVLTLLIKSAMWPLQNKATQSMKRMQVLQPRMTELKEKYKDDPTRMNTELMKLYKDYKINPLAGCLPMVVQIPIFFGFYNMLGKAVELRNSGFLWVHDLSMPDTVAHLMGHPINVLPMCMAVTMLIQMAIQPKSGDPVQQRMFMFMPLIFIYFCYNFASALALYWTVQNLFSIVQLYLTRNQVAPTLEMMTPPSKRKAR